MVCDILFCRISKVLIIRMRVVACKDVSKKGDAGLEGLGAQHIDIDLSFDDWTF